MHVGRRVDYAVRALAYLAGQDRGRVVGRAEIESAPGHPALLPRRRSCARWSPPACSSRFRVRAAASGCAGPPATSAIRQVYEVARRRPVPDRLRARPRRRLLLRLGVHADRGLARRAAPAARLSRRHLDRRRRRRLRPAPAARNAAAAGAKRRLTPRSARRPRGTSFTVAVDQPVVAAVSHALRHFARSPASSPRNRPPAVCLRWGRCRSEMLTQERPSHTDRVAGLRRPPGDDAWPRSRGAAAALRGVRARRWAPACPTRPAASIATASTRYCDHLIVRERRAAASSAPTACCRRSAPPQPAAGTAPASSTSRRSWPLRDRYRRGRPRLRRSRLPQRAASSRCCGPACCATCCDRGCRFVDRLRQHRHRGRRPRRRQRVPPPVAGSPRAGGLARRAAPRLRARRLAGRRRRRRCRRCSRAICGSARRCAGAPAWDPRLRHRRPPDDDCRRARPTPAMSTDSFAPPEPLPPPALRDRRRPALAAPPAARSLLPHCCVRALSSSPARLADAAAADGARAH